MGNTTKKVIILNKLSSPFISEAIIILKDGTVIPQSHIIAEAEKIVSAYMERTTKNGHLPKRNARLCQVKTTILLCFISAVSSFALSLYFLSS